MNKYLLWLVLAGVAFAQDSRVLDKKFWTVSAFHAATTILDYASSAAYIGPGHKCIEDQLMGFEPSDRKIALVGLADFAVTEGLAYVLKRSGNHVVRKLWLAPIAYRSGIHVWAARQNFEVCRLVR